MNIVITKHRLKEDRRQIEELMHMLMAKHDLLSKKEYKVKMELLEQKHNEIDEALTRENYDG